MLAWLRSFQSPLPLTPCGITHPGNTLFFKNICPIYKYNYNTLQKVNITTYTIISRPCNARLQTLLTQLGKLKMAPVRLLNDPSIELHFNLDPIYKCIFNYWMTVFSLKTFDHKKITDVWIYISNIT